MPHVATKYFFFLKTEFKRKLKKTENGENVSTMIQTHALSSQRLTSQPTQLGTHI
jgi:hypothetical protein